MMAAVTRRQIPGALPVEWQMRALETASITAGCLGDGRCRQLVEHAPLPGVTPAMCLWYPERVDRQLAWRGHTALACRLWHPRDHIFFARRRGSFGPGYRWHIVEASGADRGFLSGQVFEVTKLDETGSTMEVRRLGHPVVVADERWRPTAAGLCWTVEMTVGSTEPGLRTIVSALVRRRMASLDRWASTTSRRRATFLASRPSCTSPKPAADRPRLLERPDTIGASADHTGPLATMAIPAALRGQSELHPRCLSRADRVFWRLTCLVAHVYVNGRCAACRVARQLAKTAGIRCRGGGGDNSGRELAWSGPHRGR